MFRVYLWSAPEVLCNQLCPNFNITLQVTNTYLTINSRIIWRWYRKMQLDIYLEPTFRFGDMTYTDKQKWWQSLFYWITQDHMLVINHSDRWMVGQTDREWFIWAHMSFGTDKLQKLIVLSFCTWQNFAIYRVYIYPIISNPTYYVYPHSTHWH